MTNFPKKIIAHSAILMAGLSFSVTIAAQSIPSNTLQVVSSIKPLALMAQDLGLPWRDALVPDGTSFHDFSLKLSQLRDIRDADIVLWLGPELEPYLAKVMENKPADKQIIVGELLEADGKKDMHGDHDLDHHDRHHHSDLHPWTSPVFVQQAFHRIAHQIAELRPALVTDIEKKANLHAHALGQQANLARQKIHQQGTTGYLVYHDALAPFEAAMGVSALGSFADSAGVTSGAKSLANLYQLAASGRVACILIDAETNHALVNRVAPQVQKIYVDILAWQIKQGENNMQRYFQALTQAMLNCKN